MAKPTDDGFTRLFKYMEKRFNENELEHEKIFKRLDQIQGTLDDLASDYRTMVAESAATAHAIVRLDDTTDDHEDRIKQLEDLASAA